MEYILQPPSISLSTTSVTMLLLLLVSAATRSAYGEANSSPEYSRHGHSHSHGHGRSMLHSGHAPPPGISDPHPHPPRTEALASASASTSLTYPMYSPHPQYHRCYVCLPPDPSSDIYKDIVTTFAGQNVSDCSYFDSQTNVNLNPHTQFIFTCPTNHSGCLLRTHGSAVARTCAQYPIYDCKSANGIELCYCTGPLCNKDRSKFNFPLPPPPPSVGSRSIVAPYATAAGLTNDNGLFDDGETDDEDLLGPNSENGSGYGPPDLDQGHNHGHGHGAGGGTGGSAVPSGPGDRDYPPNNDVDDEGKRTRHDHDDGHEDPTNTNRIDGAAEAKSSATPVSIVANLCIISIAFTYVYSRTRALA